MTATNPAELTFEEFCSQPMTYTFGMSGDFDAQRQYHNAALGVTRNVSTERKRFGNPYAGWKPQRVTYFLDNDPREFETADQIYMAYMHRACGQKEQAS